MKNTIYITLLAIATLIIFSCKDTSQNEKSLTKEIKFTKEAALSIHHKNDSILPKTIHLDIEIADNDYERQTGLMYRKSMEENQGMLFVTENYEPQSFYMRNTLIALDIIYIDTDYKIVSFQKNAKPLDETSLPSGKPAKYVLEINAGLSEKWNLVVGDSISYTKD